MPDRHSFSRRTICVGAVLLALAACTRPIDTPPRTIVFFTNNSTALDGSARNVLDQVLKTAAGHPRAKVLVRGFAGVAGSPAADVALARRRAQVVTQALVVGGLAPGRIMEVARGATAADPGVESRRVEIELQE